MTPEEEDAFEECWELIAEAKADGLKSLHSTFEGFENLTQIPSEISELSNLNSVELNGTKINDLSPFAGLRGLQKLNLGQTQVADISPLARLRGLQVLDLYLTQVADISPLAGLSGLQMLDLGHTQVADISPLTGLRELQELFLSNTQVADISPLAGLSGLQMLDLDNTPLLQNEPALQEIYDRKNSAGKYLFDGLELVREILEWQRANGKQPPKETAPSSWSITDITQDPGGWRFDIPASLASLVVDTHSETAPDVARKLLPRVVASVFEAETVFAEGEGDPVPLIRADLTEMAKILAGDMEEIAAEALVLWELSVGLAHYLDQDTATVAARSNMPTLVSRSAVR